MYFFIRIAFGTLFITPKRIVHYFEGSYPCWMKITLYCGKTTNHSISYIHSSCKNKEMNDLQCYFCLIIANYSNESNKHFISLSFILRVYLTRESPLRERMTTAEIG